MIRIEEFIKNGITVNWLTINIGWRGPGMVGKQLAGRDIINFAIDLLVEGDNQQEDILMLACCRENESDDITALLNKLSCTQNYNKEIEIKKWQVILLMTVMENLNKKPLYGLIKFTEFWAQFDFPQGAPHVVQGLNNTISPLEYYTQENYCRIINLHRDWIELQLKELSDNY